MIYAFLESFKYVGHLFPIVILRVYVGQWFLAQALIKIRTDYLYQPKLAAMISENLAYSVAPGWYKHFLETTVIPNWQVFAYSHTYFEFLVGVSLIIGFLSRPMALVGALIATSGFYISQGETTTLYQLLLVICLVLAWLGAGRCLGLDYFFFKRQRGIFW